MTPPTVTRDELAGTVRAALNRRLTAVERLAGGSRKGVYRLTLEDGGTAIAYRWDPAENYWADAPGDPADPFSAGVGLDLFEAGHARLKALGLRVPEIHLIDRNVAIVEDFPGEELEDLFHRDPAAAEPVMERLRADLAVLRGHRAPAYGRVSWVDDGGRPPITAERAALAFGQRCLDEAAGRDRRIAEARSRIADELLARAEAVAPRSEFAVVHGELWGHVLIDRDGAPVLVDIEDIMYFDAEWEYVFLRIRLGAHYHHLAADGLDPARMALYHLVQRLSLTAGPLRLLDGDYPNREFMASIAEGNLRHVLAFT